MTTLDDIHYANRKYWSLLYELNEKTVGPDPTCIKPGQVLLIPELLTESPVITYTPTPTPTHPDTSFADLPLIPYVPGADLFMEAPSGQGKSRLQGRRICYDNYRSHIGTVVIDAVGQTIDNALDKIRRKGLSFDRLRYVNMAGETIAKRHLQTNTYSFADGTEDFEIHDLGVVSEDLYVFPLPMLHRREGDSVNDIAARFGMLLNLIDEQLAQAPISGTFRVENLLMSSVAVLSVLGLPITDLFSILRRPDEWVPRIKRAGEHKEGRDAAEELLDFIKSIDPNKRYEWSEPLLNRLRPFRHDPVLRVMVSATEPVIDWHTVAKEGLQVYLDFRGGKDKRSRQIKLFWIWKSLLDHIEHERHYTDPPLALVIDELQFFLQGNANARQINTDLASLINALKRNKNCHVYLSTQSLKSLKLLSPKVADTVMNCHNKLFGKIEDLELAKELAEKYFSEEISPTKTKELPVMETPTESEIKADLKKPLEEQVYRYHFDIYASVKRGTILGPNQFIYGPSDKLYLEKSQFERKKIEQFPPEESDYLYDFEAIPKTRLPMPMPPEEQIRELAKRFLHLKHGHWLFAKSPKEGEPAETVEPFSTVDFDKGEYVSDAEDEIAKIRARLMRKHGIKVEEPEPDPEPEKIKVYEHTANTPGPRLPGENGGNQNGPVQGRRRG